MNTTHKNWKTVTLFARNLIGRAGLDYVQVQGLTGISVARIWEIVELEKEPLLSEILAIFKALEVNILFDTLNFEHEEIREALQDAIEEVNNL